MSFFKLRISASRYSFLRNFFTCCASMPSPSRSRASNASICLNFFASARYLTSRGPYCGVSRRISPSFDALPLSPERFFASRAALSALRFCAYVIPGRLADSAAANFFLVLASSGTPSRFARALPVRLCAPMTVVARASSRSRSKARARRGLARAAAAAAGETRFFGEGGKGSTRWMRGATFEIVIHRGLERRK